MVEKLKCLCFLSILIMAMSGCFDHPQIINMATTASIENSGLLAYLLPNFTKISGIGVDVIAVGTGKAIKLGENGDVDLIFVHAREAEDKFVEQGSGVNREDVMYNDFVILGPKNDPAHIAGLKDAPTALKRIAAKRNSFVSRGDESGTHKKEKLLWNQSGMQPKGKWYISVGQGMGAVLVMANEKLAYAFSDRGTFIAYEDKIDLVVLCEGDKRLANPYSIIAVNPKKHKHVKYRAAMEFINWIVSEEGQELIGAYRKNGKQLFYPNARQP